MAREFTEIAKIDRRIRDLTTWLEENAPNCGTEQNISVRAAKSECIGTTAIWLPPRCLAASCGPRIV